MVDVRVTISDEVKERQSAPSEPDCCASCCLPCCHTKPQQSIRLSKRTPFPKVGIPGMVVSAARASPRKPAVRGPLRKDGTYKQISYLELLLNAKLVCEKVTSVMHGNGVEQCVAIMLPRDVPFVIAALGVMLNGLSSFPPSFLFLLLLFSFFCVLRSHVGLADQTSNSSSSHVILCVSSSTMGLAVCVRRGVRAPERETAQGPAKVHLVRLRFVSAHHYPSII